MIRREIKLFDQKCNGQEENFVMFESRKFCKYQFSSGTFTINRKHVFCEKVSTIDYA